MTFDKLRALSTFILSAYYVLGTHLSARYIKVNIIDKSPWLYGADVLEKYEVFYI